MPDTVYRVCDLIVVVVGKYGDEWRDQCLQFILNETLELIKQVCSIYCDQQSMSKPSAQADQPFAATAGAAVQSAFTEQRLASRLLLFCLLFEEMQLACAKIVNSSQLLDKLVQMLQMVTNSTNFNKQSSISHDLSQTTPVWLTSLFILIDLIEKAALSTKRKVEFFFSILFF